MKAADRAGRQRRCPDRYRAGKRLWTPADEAALRRLYPETPTVDLARRLRRSLASVYARAGTLGLRKSAVYLASPHACRLRRPGWFAGRMRETQFKKGQRNGVAARQWMPVGSTRLIDGYVYRKVSDVSNVYYSVNWKPEHVLLWTRAHGPVPAGHALAFRNGDKADIRLDNLECLSRRELMARNSVHNLPAPLAQTIQLLGALQRQIRRKTRGQEPHRRSA